MIRFLRKLFGRSDPPQLPDLKSGGDRDYILYNPDSLIYDLLALIRATIQKGQDEQMLARSIMLNQEHHEFLRRFRKNHDMLFDLLQAKGKLIKEPLSQEEESLMRGALKRLKIKE